MKPRLSFRKPTIKAEEWETIREQSEAAKELLNEPRFSFFRDYLEQAKSSVIDLFVRNKIRPVQEHLKISDILTKTFTTTKPEQEAELSGKYAFIEDLLADLQRIASLPDEYLKAQSEGKIEIESDKEK